MCVCVCASVLEASGSTNDTHVPISGLQAKGGISVLSERALSGVLP